MIKLLGFDMDGTLTQHKSPLEESNRRVLEALSQKYHLLMIGAGSCERIFNQLGHFPIDILGNYGMEWGEYDAESKSIRIVKKEAVPCDRESIEKRTDALRQEHGYTSFAGDSVEYHASGCVTIALLGTKANLQDKLQFDPDRSKRRAFYQEVVELFPEYNVFVGGSSSFDMSPLAFNKYTALAEYCKIHGIRHEEVVFFGDDYGMGGNDEAVFQSDIPFQKVDDYRTFPEIAKSYLASPTLTKPQ